MPKVRLIDANAFLENVLPECKYPDALKKAVENQPTIEAEPVRHGRWIFGSSKTSCWMTCSNCCKSQSGQTACFSYCPNCGAKMDATDTNVGGKGGADNGNKV